MKFNQWTLGLAAAGVISLPLVTQAEEAQSQVMTALSSTTLSGYVDTSAIWNLGTGTGLVGRSYDGAAKQDGFNLNVVKLQLDKPLDEGQWSAGYRVGLLFGPDANTYGTTSSALIPAFGPDFAVKDAYITLRAPVGNGLDFKIGVFDNPLAYETFEAGNNPNYSRSFGFATEVRALTGVQVSYRLHESVAILGGIANTGGPKINSRVPGLASATSGEAQKTYFGGISLTAPESAGFLKGATLDAGVIDATRDKVAGKNMIWYFAGATLPLPVEGLSLGAAWDYAANTIGTGPSHQQAFAGYLTYQATEKMKVALRSDYATGGTGAWAVAKGVAEDVSLWGNTATLDYSLWENVISRLEFRWDHSLNGLKYFGTGNHRNSFSVALNVIYKF
jgi:hypothetical protein